MKVLREDLNTSQCLRILDNLNSIHLPVLYFAGGEPLLRGDLGQIAQKAFQMGIFTILFTNGTLITPDRAEELAGVFHSIFISLDGPKHHNDELRGQGSYERSMQGIHNLLAWKQKVRVNVNTVVNMETVYYLEDLIRDIRPLGIHKIQVHPEFSPSNRAEPEIEVDLQRQLLNLKRRYSTLLDGDEIYFRGLSKFLSTKCTRECEANSLLHIAILPDGRVSACCAFHAPIGDIQQTNLVNILEETETSPSLLGGCPGCYRQDYRSILSLFDHPLSVLRWSHLKRLSGL